MFGLLTRWRMITGLVTGVAATTTVFQAPAAVSSGVCEARYLFRTITQPGADAAQIAEVDLDADKPGEGDGNKCGITRADQDLHNRQKEILAQLTQIAELLKGGEPAD